MKTWQDLLACGENEQDRIDFILAAINEHKSTQAYRRALDAEMYYKHMNPTIMRAQKFIYDVVGQKVPDIWSANNKIPSNYYFYFVNQEVGTLLGNGVSFSDAETKNKLGGIVFDKNVFDLAIEAVNAGVSFGLFDNGSLRKFSLLEFKPLFDENTGALCAGIRFWQLEANKPLYCTLYEPDGFTDYVRNKDEEMRVLNEKRSYIIVSRVSDATGEEIIAGWNYPSFPIVPFYNINKQSELVGTQETIDAYDLMLSALVNNMDDANIIYWVIKNAGGMDSMDDQRFIEQLKTMHVTHTEGNESIDAHTIDVPFEASEAGLSRLRNQLFDDFMALDTKNISNGATTATQIRAAYEPLNCKLNQFENCVTEFILGILALAGIQDEPTYTRDYLVNQQEMIQTILLMNGTLPSDYIVSKLLEVMGDIDRKDDILGEIDSEEYERFSSGGGE